MVRIGARVKGALLGVAATPVVAVCAAVGWATFAIVGSLIGGVLLGKAGAAPGSQVGGVGGALLAGGFAVGVLGEVRGGPDGPRRVLVVMGLAALTAAGTWFSPFLGRMVAPLAAVAAFFAAAALSGAALLTPHAEVPDDRAWLRRPGAP